MSIGALAMDAIVKRFIARGGKQVAVAEIARRQAAGPPAPAAVPPSVAKRFGITERTVAGSRVVGLNRRDAPRGRAVVFLAGGPSSPHAASGKGGAPHPGGPRPSRVSTVPASLMKTP